MNTEPESSVGLLGYKAHALIMEPTCLGVVVQDPYLPTPLEKEKQASSSGDTDNNNGSQLGISVSLRLGWAFFVYCLIPCS